MAITIPQLFPKTNPKLGGIVSAAILALFMHSDVEGQLRLVNGGFVYINNTTVNIPGIVVDDGEIHGKGNLHLYSGDFANNTNGEIFNNMDSVTVSLDGTTQQRVAGTNGINFHNLIINNPAGVAIATSVLSDTKVRSILHTSVGKLDLNGKNIDLGYTGQLQQDANNYPTDTISGGTITAHANFDAPVAVNPGNLNVTITGVDNMGDATIVYGYMKQFPTGGYCTVKITLENNPTNDIAVSIQYLPHQIHPDMGDPNFYDIHQENNQQRNATAGTSLPGNNEITTILTNGFHDGLTIGAGQSVSIETISYSSSETISLYPNPSIDGNITIEIQSELQKNIELSVINMQGEIVLTDAISTQRGLTQGHLDLSMLAAGVYLIHIDGKVMKCMITM